MGNKSLIQNEIKKIRKNLLSIEQSIVLRNSSIIVKNKMDSIKMSLRISNMGAAKKVDDKFFLPTITYDGHSCYCIIQLEKYLLLDYLERYKKAGKNLKYIDAIL